MALRGGTRFAVRCEDVFPAGCALVPESLGEVEDYDEKTGQRSPAKDKLTGQRVWQVRVMDLDPELGKRSRETYFMATANGAIPAYFSKRCFRADIKDRRRAREYGAKLTPGRRHAIFERDNWICQICGEPVARAAAVPQPDAPTIDHILALARGGAHGEDNWATAHFICNSMKRDIQLKLKVFPRGRFASRG